VLTFQALVRSVSDQDQQILQDFQSNLGVKLRLVGNREVEREGSLEGVEMYEIRMDLACEIFVQKFELKLIRQKCHIFCVFAL
jgi:hypothetical protein